MGVLSESTFWVTLVLPYPFRHGTWCRGSEGDGGCTEGKQSSAEPEFGKYDCVYLWQQFVSTLLRFCLPRTNVLFLTSLGTFGQLWFWFFKFPITWRLGAGLEKGKRGIKVGRGRGERGGEICYPKDSVYAASRPHPTSYFFLKKNVETCLIPCSINIFTFLEAIPCSQKYKTF